MEIIPLIKGLFLNKEIRLIRKQLCFLIEKIKKFSLPYLESGKKLRAALRDGSRSAIAVTMAIIITFAFTATAQAEEVTVRSSQDLVTIQRNQDISLDSPEALTAALDNSSYPNKTTAAVTTDTVIQVAALTSKVEAPAKPAEPEPTTTTTTRRLARVYPTTTRSTSTARYTGKFASGYCTDYVDQNVDWVDWRGNAKAWDENAAANGHRVGFDQAKPGNIVVTKESGYGHVAVVEKVEGNTVTISEWNYSGRYNRTERQLDINDPRIENFIGK